ncbi:MAG: response regulator [Phormidesmis sp.]
MWNRLSSGLFSSHYVPHGHCYLWQTPLVALHATSDLLIALAYFSIPAALVYFIYKRKHPFPVRLTLLFGSFILLCGIGHLFDIVTLWYPVYWLSGAIRAATALVSGYTAVELTVLLPHFLAMQDVNQRLETDAQERVVRQRGLEENQRIFKSAFYDIPIGMVLVSLDGFFREANEAILEILGYSKAELLSLDFQSITHPDDLETDLTLVNELIAGERRYYQFEKRYFHKLGHIVPVELSVALLRDAEDHPLLFIAHVNDVSEQKRINASLQAATQAAEAANRSKSEFLAMMSHEIRTPMNAMLGMTELIEETALDNQQQDFVEVIRTSGKTLLTVINDILDFSKIESDKLELEERELDLYDCIEDILTLFYNQAENKGLLLTCLVEPPHIPDTFKGDSVRLRQILSNLVNNSIKFTETGEVSLRIKLSKVDANAVAGNIPKTDSTEDGRIPIFYKVQFSVKDTGIGISQDKISRLFQPFCQVDSSVTRQYGGTGLGLVISKRLVAMMGGALSVESELGQGSTFHFSLIMETYEEPSPETSRYHNRIACTNVDLSSKRLLIVAANQTNSEYLSLQAESWDLEVTVVPSAAAALAELAEHDFDAIAIDEAELEIDSVHLALKIRRLDNHSRTPLLLLQRQKKSAEEPLNELDVCTKLLRQPVRRSHFYEALVQLLLDNGESTEHIYKTRKESISKQRSTHSLEQPATAKPLDAKKPLKILLTEDIALNQKVALHMLAAYNYQADIANNGAEAVAALKREQYDLVLMDVQMPVMDGLEATRTIRSDSSISQPHIVAMTAHAMQGDREECLAVGMNDYIRKPIGKRDLLAVLQQCPQKSVAASFR